MGRAVDIFGNSFPPWAGELGITIAYSDLWIFKISYGAGWNSVASQVCTKIWRVEKEKKRKPYVKKII